MHQINVNSSSKKQQLLPPPTPTPPPPQIHFKTASTGSMVKIIVILAVVVIISLYFITNIFFSYELSIRHKASVDRLQERLKQYNHQHHFAENIETDANGKEKKHSIEEIHDLHKEPHQGAIESITTRTPSAKVSGMTFKRTVAIPFPASAISAASRKIHQQEHDKQGHELKQNEYLKLGFRDVGVEDVSLQLHNQHNWRQFSEHYVRAARGFFPPEVAQHWRHEFLRTWRMSERIRKHEKKLIDGVGDDDEDHWLFTTNNDGHNFGRKEASKNNVEARKNFALLAYNRNHDTFAYTKWEMQRKHPLHLEIKEYMKSKETKIALCKMLAEDCPDGFVEKATLGDFFLSLFEADDFLSPHSDGALGSITIAAHFLVDTSSVEGGMNNSSANAENDDDPEKFEAQEGSTESGAVEFFCQDKKSWCVKLKVNKNELVVFRTQPDNALHRVTQMMDRRYLRFGVTGFYAMPGEVQILEY